MEEPSPNFWGLCQNVGHGENVKFDFADAAGGLVLRLPVCVSRFLWLLLISPSFGADCSSLIFAVMAVDSPGLGESSETRDSLKVKLGSALDFLLLKYLCSCAALPDRCHTGCAWMQNSLCCWASRSVAQGDEGQEVSCSQRSSWKGIMYLGQVVLQTSVFLGD